MRVYDTKANLELDDKWAICFGRRWWNRSLKLWINHRIISLPFLPYFFHAFEFQCVDDPFFCWALLLPNSLFLRGWQIISCAHGHLCTARWALVAQRAIHEPQRDTLWFSKFPKFQYCWLRILNLELESWIERVNRNVILIQINPLWIYLSWSWSYFDLHRLVMSMSSMLVNGERQGFSPTRVYSITVTFALDLQMFGGCVTHFSRMYVFVFSFDDA